MKVKRNIIGLLLFIIVFLCGCDVQESKPYTFDYQALKEKVIGAQIQYRDDQTLQDEQLYVFQEDEIPSFLEEFFGFSFHTVGPAHPKASHYLIKLLYNDGSFDLIGTNGGERYNARGKFNGSGPFCAPSSYQAYYNLLAKYIKIEKYYDCWGAYDKPIISN